MSACRRSFSTTSTAAGAANATTDAALSTPAPAAPAPNKDPAQVMTSTNLTFLSTQRRQLSPALRIVDERFFASMRAKTRPRSLCFTARCHAWASNRVKGSQQALPPRFFSMGSVICATPRCGLSARTTRLAGFASRHCNQRRQSGSWRALGAIPRRFRASYSSTKTACTSAAPPRCALPAACAGPGRGWASSSACPCRCAIRCTTQSRATATAGSDGATPALCLIKRSARASWPMTRRPLLRRGKTCRPRRVRTDPHRLNVHEFTDAEIRKLAPVAAALHAAEG